MNGLRSLDRLLLATLLPIWVVGFALAATSTLRHPGYASVFVSAPGSAEGHPRVAGFRSWSAGSASELRVGDRLLALGGEDLRGAGPFDFFVRVAEAAGPDHRVALAFERDGERLRTSLAVGCYAMFWPYLLPSFAFALTAVILLLRARPSPMVRAFFHSFVCIALVFGTYVAGSRLVTTAATAVNLAAWTLVLPLTLRAALFFPKEDRARSPAVRLAPWLFVAAGLLVPSSRFGAPLPAEIGEPGLFLALAAFFALVIAILTRNYLEADAIGRRQLRWAILGIYCAALPALLGSALAGWNPRFTPHANGLLAATTLFPVALLIGVARYNLFDVDRLLSATASVNLLVVLGVGVGFLVVPRAGEAAAELLAVDAMSGRVLVGMLLATGFVPAHRWFRPRIERAVFAERYAVDRGIEALLRELARCEGARSLTRTAGERLAQVLRPAGCVVYAREGGLYTPVFVEGSAAPPGFDAESPLVAALRGSPGPLALGGPGGPRDAPPLRPFDRAALETLGAEVVVPVRRGGELLAFLCLGAKRSGDVYTTTDLALLAAVAENVSLRLGQYDQLEVIRESRSMREELRRYVPGAVAERLEAGRDLRSGEFDVSVFFIDLRGYTGLVEGEPAHEIFSTVNRYTEAVSEIVREEGGSVVEFNGDGMMAVFGVPDALPSKERAAVEAGRRCVATVAGLRGPGGAAPLSVGVGIATGKAFVGSIRAADRLIWSAVGDTTNLAARLQTQSRVLDAAIVIDEATWRGAQGAAADFERHEKLPVRGRREPIAVYALPARAAAPAPVR